jgi:ATP-dependent helicase YprA (DUF1998 family)
MKISTQSPPTITETIAEMQRALSDYIEATYHISDPAMVRQRQSLLNTEGVIYRKPFIESTPRYQTGDEFASIKGLPKQVGEFLTSLSKKEGENKGLLFNPPYTHQGRAIHETLVNDKSLIVMTGTGSGKTESFLMPILGKLAIEASTVPSQFKDQAAVRALVLYPMNALVNDQLGRLRLLFGDARVASQFVAWAGRPLRFGRYTSRTLYPGVRSDKKDGKRLTPIRKYYVHHLENQQTDDGSRRLVAELKKRGKWPSKPDLKKWFGGGAWTDSKTGLPRRAVTLPEDRELWTRHEVHAAPPDVLVTNYSMLEYMLMRPLERGIFDATRRWLEHNPTERLMLILDEAHLYRGAGGSEVALLIRRLIDRLGITPDRLQVICTTASFSKHAEAPKFAAQLTGKLPSDFEPIRGDLKMRPSAATGGANDANILASVDLERFYSADRDERLEEARKVTDYLKHSIVKEDIEASLYAALEDYPPLSLLVNITMKQAQPVEQLGEMLFPTSEPTLRDRAVTALLALGSAARKNTEEAGLLPCRIHSFFRGLPGLWACMDPACNERPESEISNAGKLYSQPRDLCGCGARVLELYTCRHCGTLYARSYTNDLETPTYLWSEPGETIQTATGLSNAIQPLDLLLEEPMDGADVEPAEYDLVTGSLNPAVPSNRMRLVYLKKKRTEDYSGKTKATKTPRPAAGLGEFKPCAVCDKSGSFNRSSVQDHQTKGDQPFQALVSRQIQIQPPGPMAETALAPLRGRKVLIFSDSRQMAARLAPNIQKYSNQDALRPLICEGFRYLQSFADIAPLLTLDHLYLAVLLSAKRLGVRLRPELKASEKFEAEKYVSNYVTKYPSGDSHKLLALLVQVSSMTPPEALFAGILSAFDDRYYGLESLALGSLAERTSRSEEIHELPDIPGFASTPESKITLARAWLQLWQNAGFYLSKMPTTYETDEIKAVAGSFAAQMKKILPDASARKFFDNQWLPRLKEMFCDTVSESENKYKLKGNELTLVVGGEWAYCSTCQTTQRPPLVSNLCANCGKKTANLIDPDNDLIFKARKGYYRESTVGALLSPENKPFSLIAAEHTAQLGSAQADDVFSKAEENELLFQDVDLGPDDTGRSRPAIDVLSCTTTMEVGIDIGALSGVSLRNLPPSRANYQQRAGRAGRRGNAVATVTAFGSADSHDEHFFQEPEAMIAGEVDDPRLTLDNEEIIKRHVFAYLLQRYHEDRIPGFDASIPANLFAVLGTVGSFMDSSSILNRADFEAWLTTNVEALRKRISVWIPREFDGEPRVELLDGLVNETLMSLDDALRMDIEDQKTVGMQGIEDDEEDENVDEVEASSANLLDRLLYKGVLPRYAFPTDVASFYVFDQAKYKDFKPAFKFSPSQGLSVALSQYAPGKEVWISGKQYRSGAIYSPYRTERFEAWKNRQIYFECEQCGYAKKFRSSEADKGEKRDCPACKTSMSFGVSRDWLRPPGFAHPVEQGEETSPDDQPARSYATRAKLSYPTPTDEASWMPVNERLKTSHLKKHLLVTNRGPDEQGYDYCTFCGLIGPSTSGLANSAGTHQKPYPDSKQPRCSGAFTKGIVLGTDFITDVLLVSLTSEEPIDLSPSSLGTTIALRTVCEAVTKAACSILELEPNELQAEFRPAVNAQGSTGAQMELYLYDTLPGGAGFAKQVGLRGEKVFREALRILEACPDNCDRSCYRCLRSYKNKFDHEFLDRFVGAALLRYLLEGERPAWDNKRLEESREILFRDLVRQNHPTAKIRRDISVPTSTGSPVIAPILIERQDGLTTIVDVSGVLTPSLPAEGALEEIMEFGAPLVRVVEELQVRRNLPSATASLWKALNL